MDFGAFHKEAIALVKKAVETGVAVAPAYKAAATAVTSVFMPPLAPIVAAIPSDVLLAQYLAVPTYGLSYLILDPDLRPGRKGVDVDYFKLGDAAAQAYLKGS